MLRYEKHQDTIAVNSVEETQHLPPLTGVEHYLHIFHRKGHDLKPSLDHIDYGKLERPPDDYSLFEVLEDNLTPQTAHGAASPPPSPASYAQPIYSGTTRNPAVFLSILRVAERNRPDLDLVSATNHIPNIRPTDLLPPLFPAAPGNLAPQPFLDTTYPYLKRDGDVDMAVAFLPHFYNGGERHAIGFYDVLTCHRRGRVLGTAFFTPCSEEDLRRYGLVVYVESWDDGDVQGLEEMASVGCCEGGWVERDTVEEYEEWRMVLRVASVAWERRMGLLRGELEG